MEPLCTVVVANGSAEATQTDEEHQGCMRKEDRSGSAGKLLVVISSRPPHPSPHRHRAAAILVIPGGKVNCV